MHDFEFFGFVATGHRATLVSLGSGATIERSSSAPEFRLFNVTAVLIATLGDFALTIDIVDFRQHQFDYKMRERLK